MTSHEQPLYEHDLEVTKASRDRLQSNANLMFWYRELYRDLFISIPDIAQKKVLEIGSGTSPLKYFLPSVITSDILRLDYLDIIFDCHDIAELEQIPDSSIDIISLTNVLHHLRDPIRFLHGAKTKLAEGGQIIIVEPYFSLLSYPIYKILHHEPVDFGIQRPVLEKVEGPLSSSNQAMPHMIFFSKSEWLNELNDYYDLNHLKFSYYTGLAYMATGGISRNLHIPRWIYRPFFVADRYLARFFPRIFASFFCARLLKKDSTMTINKV